MFVERSSTILIIIISKFRDGALATAHLCQNSEKTFSEKNSLLPYFPILWAKILGLYAQDTPLSQKNISIRRFGKITVGKSGRRTHHKICFFGRLLASKYIFTYRKIFFSWFLNKINLSTGPLQDEHPTRVFLSFYKTELLHIDRPDFMKTWIKNFFFSLIFQWKTYPNFFNWHHKQVVSKKKTYKFFLLQIYIFFLQLNIAYTIDICYNNCNVIFI